MRQLLKSKWNEPSPSVAPAFGWALSAVLVWFVLGVVIGMVAPPNLM